MSHGQERTQGMQHMMNQKLKHQVGQGGVHMQDLMDPVGIRALKFKDQEGTQGVDLMNLKHQSQGGICMTNLMMDPVGIRVPKFKH